MSFLSNLAQSGAYYDYSYNSSYTGEDTALGAGFFILYSIIWLVIAVASYVVYAIFLGKIFKKAGIESWKAWVPFYNVWILLELGGQPGFWAILSIVPFVNIASAVFVYIAMYHVGLRLQKDGVFILLGIFLPLVWYIWLGVDKSVWQGPKPAASVPESPAN